MFPVNPYIYDEQQGYGVYFKQTRDTLLDTQEYISFVYNIDNKFKRSAFYKDFKSSLMDKGFYRDQMHASITSDMTNIEMHHNGLTLKFMTIMIIEHLLNVNGCVNTFEVIRALEEAHRSHEIAVVMLSETEHQKFHSDPCAFISFKMCVGDPFAFIDRYIDGMTQDIAFALLLHLKQEEQYNGSYSPNEIRARDEILKWQMQDNNL